MTVTADHVRLTRLDWPEVLAEPDDWDRLRQRAPTETPFLTPEWLEAWWRHLGPSGRPSILGLEEHGRLQALAPWYRARLAPSGLVALRPLGRGVSDYLDLLLPSDAWEREVCLARLLDGMLVRSSGWDVLDLPNLPAESPTVGDLTRLAGARGLAWAVLSGHARPAVALGGTWDGYLGSRPGRFRYNLRSRLRRLGQLGAVRFRTAAATGDVWAGLEVLTRLHARRWAGQRTGTVFSQSARGRRFYAEASQRYAGRGLLELTLLDVTGRPAAGSLCFVERGTSYYYLAAWEPELARYAPSTLLLGHLIERAFDRGLRRFDLMIGDEPYKDQWATEERRTVRVAIANRGPRGRVAFAAIVGGHRARQRARGSELLRRAYRHGVGTVLRDGLSAVGARVGAPPAVPADKGRRL